MNFYDQEGIEVDVKQFDPGSLVVMRVTMKHDKEEWQRFMKNNQNIAKVFQDHGIKVVFCPDWIEFKQWS